MAQGASIENFWAMTYREVYLRWQAALRDRYEPLASILCTIDNGFTAVVHSIPFTKRAKPKWKKPSEYLPWAAKGGAEVIRIDNKDFKSLMPIFTSQG